jgi:tRNA threonylcarbamoyladenosine biosynthesis protein TsaB
MTNRGAVLAFDTATTATVVGLSVGGEVICELADRPAADQRPRHAERLLALCEEALIEAGIAWGDLNRIGVGVGPGTFTGLRIGVATAQGLAQASGVELVAVSTLEALALPTRTAEPALQVAAVGDARRGEAYIAAWSPGGERTVGDQACPPQQLVAALAAESAATIAVGDGALIFRKELEIGSIAVPDDGSALHQLAGAALCQLASGSEPVGAEELVPRYVRQPDAEISLQARIETK